MLLPFSTYTKPLGKDSDFNISLNSREILFLSNSSSHVYWFDCFHLLVQLRMCLMLWVGVQMNLKTNIEATKEKYEGPQLASSKFAPDFGLTSLFMRFCVITWPSFKIILIKMMSTTRNCFNSFLPQYWYCISFCGNLNSATGSDFLLDL